MAHSMNWLPFKPFFAASAGDTDEVIAEGDDAVLVALESSLQGGLQFHSLISCSCLYEGNRQRVSSGASLSMAATMSWGSEARMVWMVSSRRSISIITTPTSTLTRTIMT